MWLFIWDTQPSKIFVGDTQISKVFVWDTQVRPSGWQPWANTLCYLPIDANDTTSTVYDHSWNWKDFSCTNCSFQTLSSGKRVLSLSNGYLSRSWAMFSSGDFTVNIWVSWCAKLFSNIDISSYNYWIEIYKNSVALFQRNAISNINWTSIENSWYNICVIINDDYNQKVYINWTQVGSSSENPRWSSMSGITTYLWYTRWSQQASTWRIWAVILETGNWTVQEMLDYYNSTKSDYWLS